MTYPPQGPQQPHGGHYPPQPGQPTPPPVYVNVHQTVHHQQHMNFGGRQRVRWTFWEIMLVLFTCGLAWPYVWMRHRRLRRANRLW